MNILYFTYPISAALIFTLGLGLGFYLTRKFNLNWRLYWIGGLVFVLSQVFHIPFNMWALPALVEAGILPSIPEPWNLPYSALILGLSAGIFEETARYIMYRWFTKDARSWNKGVLIGAGHGGIEAIIVGVLILTAYVQLVALKNADLPAIVPPDQLDLVQQQVAVYWSTAWYDSMLGFVERLFTIPVHICLSVMVLQVFIRRQLRWLFLAIGWHTLLNAAAVVGIQTWGIYMTEVVIGLFSIISIGILFALRKPEESEPTASLSAPPRTEEAYQPSPPEETPDNIDNTRYSS
jgi:uncharacterized membrane protein YhfC